MEQKYEHKEKEKDINTYGDLCLNHLLKRFFQSLGKGL